MTEHDEWFIVPEPGQEPLTFGPKLHWVRVTFADGTQRDTMATQAEIDGFNEGRLTPLAVVDDEGNQSVVFADMSGWQGTYGSCG